MSKLIIKNRFATIPNQLLFDGEISLKAKGLYGYIQAKPDGWDFSAERISRDCKEGLQSIRATLRELEDAKYLIREKKHNDKGFWEIEYILFAEPYQRTENQRTENQRTENHTTDNPTTENNADNINTDSTNKELEKKNNKPTESDIDFNSLLVLIKEKTKRNFEVPINEKIQKKYLSRLKEGYTKKHISIAIKNAVKDEYHISKNYRYLTPEFFSRSETLDKYADVTEIKEPVKNNNVPLGPWTT